jgi:transposase
MTTTANTKEVSTTTLEKTGYSSVASVGIDVSKEKLDVALLREGNKTEKSVFKNTAQGIEELSSFLKKQGTAGTVPLIIESTGDYHLLSALILSGEGLAVKVINPLITKKHQKSSIRDAKSDPVDAARLAQIGLLEPGLPLFQENKDTVSAKKLVSYLKHLEGSKQQLQRSLRAIKETQGLLGISIDLSGTEESLRSIDKQIKKIKKRICEFASPQAKQLARELPGVSEEQMAVIFTILNGKDFSDRNQLIAFTGLDIRLRKSGKWQGAQKLTKRGNPMARKTLFQIAWSLKQNNPVFAEYYNRLYRENGKKYNEAMVAVARKFLRMLYGYYWKGTVEL